MKKLLSITVCCFVFFCMLSSVDAKEKNPYRKYQGQISKYEDMIDKENAKNKPNFKFIMKLDAKIKKSYDDMKKAHEKNKEKYLDKKLASLKKKLESARAKGGNTDKILNKIADLEDAFEEKYGKYYVPEDGGKK